MDAAGLRYVQRDNCFTWLEDPEQAQRLMDRQVRSDWPALLNGIARSLNPRHAAMFAGLSDAVLLVDLSERMGHRHHVRHSRDAGALYPRLVQHGLTTFLSPDVMRFLGRNIPPSGNLPSQPAGRSGQRREAPAGGRADQAPAGRELGEDACHGNRPGYDKQGSVLRVETTINDAAATSRPYRDTGGQTATRHQAGSACARASLICIAGRRSRRRPTTATFRRLPRWRTPRRWASLRHGCAGRPGTTADAFGHSTRMRPPTLHCSSAISRGEFTLNGFRNRDLAPTAVQPSPGLESPSSHRQAAAVSRKLLLLRAHHLIRKVPRTHRYHLTDQAASPSPH